MCLSVCVCVSVCYRILLQDSVTGFCYRESPNLCMSVDYCTVHMYTIAMNLDAIAVHMYAGKDCQLFMGFVIFFQHSDRLSLITGCGRRTRLKYLHIFNKLNLAS